MNGPLLTRPPGSPPETLTEYRAAGGYEALQGALAGRAPAEIVREVSESGLRGRGGAGFPTGRKWELAAAAEETPRYVVANGGEHEPGSRKDRLLVTEYPHKVLEGLALCAYATGASEAWLYLIEDMAEALASARAALDEARGAGLVGPSVLGRPFGIEGRVGRAAEVSGAGRHTA